MTSNDTGTDADSDDSVRYLSLAWIRELTRESADNETLARLSREHDIGVTQVVTGGPEGDVTYHVRVGDGEVMFGPGPAEPEHVRMQQDWTTAVEVATGVVNPGEAFVTGRILLTGDQQKLIAAQPFFGALDQVFSDVRARTRYE